MKHFYEIVDELDCYEKKSSIVFRHVFSVVKLEKGIVKIKENNSGFFDVDMPASEAVEMFLEAAAWVGGFTKKTELKFHFKQGELKSNLEIEGLTTKLSIDSPSFNEEFPYFICESISSQAAKILCALMRFKFDVIDS